MCHKLLRLLSVPFIAGITMALAGGSRVNAQQVEPTFVRSVAKLSASPKLRAESLTTTFRKEIALADAEGAKFPKLQNAKGFAPRRCIVAGQGTTLSADTSGDFVAGPFSKYSRIWHTGTGKLWWRPAQMDTSAALVVDVRRLDAPDVRRTYRSTTVGWTSNGLPFHNSTPFYPTNIKLPSIGIWMLVARAGVNWGCFVFRLD